MEATHDKRKDLQFFVCEFSRIFQLLWTWSDISACLGSLSTRCQTVNWILFLLRSLI